jgi:signal transduction histidine kinase
MGDRVIVDMSERMQREHELELLATTAAALGRCANPAETRELILDAVCQALDTGTAGIASANHEAGLLVVDSCRGEWAHAKGHTQPLGMGVAGEVLVTHEPYVSDDVRKDPRVVHAEFVRTMQAVACVPLLLGDRTIGVLAVGCSSPLDAANVRLLVTLAGMAAGALDRMLVLATLEQRVDQRTQELLEANRRLEQLAHHKDDFLATMSHELRTPLTAVLGLSEALNTGVYGQVNERQQHAIQVILQSGRHLLHLINGLLDLSRIEAGYADLHLEPCSLHLVAQSCVALITEMARAKQQQVMQDIPQPVTLVADTRRLHQLLLNLLSNASKFTPEGGTITLRVHGDRASNTVAIEVADTGIGIAEQDHARIFEPFVQLDASLSRQYAGTGLGLAMVQRIAALHGGRVEVFSRPGEGSRFVVTLPWRHE